MPPKKQTPHLLGRHGVPFHPLFLNRQFPLIRLHLNASADDASADGANDAGDGDGANGDDHRSKDRSSTTGQGQRKRQGGPPGKEKAAGAGQCSPKPRVSEGAKPTLGLQRNRVQERLPTE